MKFKKAIAALLAAVLVMGCVCGCADSSSSSSGSSAGTSSQGEEASTGSGETVDLLYTYWGSSFEKEAQASAIATFNEEHPNIQVEALHIPSSGSEYVAKLTAMTASGTNPDIGYMDVSTAFVWAQDDQFYDIFELIDQDPDWDKEKYVDDIFYMYDEGKSIGTTSSINQRAIFYNTDCFTEAGVELPPTDVNEAWTWDEFIEVAKQLTFDANGNTPDSPDFDATNILQYGVYWNPNTLLELGIFLDSNGADLLTEDGTQLALDTPEAKEVIQAIHDMIYVHHVCPIPNDFSAMPDGTTWLANKQCAMFITGQWVLLDIAKLDFNYGIGQLPKFKEARNVKDAGVRVIFKNTKYPEQAWELYKYLANPEGAMALYEEGLWMPTLREWYDEPKFSEWGADNPAHPESYKPVIADSLFNGSATPSYTLRIANYAELNNTITPLLQQIWLDTSSVDDVVQQINEQAGGLVQGFNPDNYHASQYRE